MTVHHVTVQLRKPVGDDLGQVTEGFYVVQDGVLSLTDDDGDPLMGKNGVPVVKRHVLKPGDNAEAIARVLTKKARREILGLTETQESFGRKLGYQPNGVA